MCGGGGGGGGGGVDFRRSKSARRAPKTLSALA